MFEFIEDKKRNYRNGEIIRSLFLPSAGKVLDVSCGDGKFLNQVHQKYPGLSLFGIDMDESDIAHAKEHCTFANFFVANAENLPFEAKRFDSVICSLSLHHYENPEKVLGEISRVLFPSGTLHLIDIIPEKKFNQKVANFIACKQNYHFEKFYSLDETEELLKKKGFSLKENKSLFVFPAASFFPWIRVLRLTR